MQNRFIPCIESLRVRRSFVKGLVLVAGALTLSGLTGCSWSHRHPSELSGQELVTRVDRGAKWMLWKVDATEEQEAKVKSVLDRLTPDVVELQARHKALKGRFANALAADQINQVELAQLRTAGLDLTERAFNRSFDAMVQAAGVLTPDQRKKLAEAWKDRP